MSDAYDDTIPDADVAAVLLDQRVRGYGQQRGPRALSAITVPSDGEGEGDSDGQREQELEQQLSNTIDLTADDDDAGNENENGQNYHGNARNRRRQQRRQQHQQHQYPQPGEQNIQAKRMTLRSGKVIKVNFCYEVRPIERFFTVEFVQVREFFTRGPLQRLFVRALPLARNRTLSGQLPRKTNEVFAIYENQDDDRRPIDEQALIEIPASSLLTSRRLHVTNADYPKHRHDFQHFSSQEDVERTGPLVCRWKYRVYFQNEATRAAGTPHEWAIVRITADEVPDPRLREDNDAVRRTWRGTTIRGGEHNAPGVPAADPPDPPRTRAPGQRYTLFDSFCGAGGASRGAERAGFHVKYGLDLWNWACESYRMNFPRATLYEMDVFDFVHGGMANEARADMLHLSPPCQVWSPAHTISGANDERNIMALFACRTLVDRVRPRMVTLEQTFGLLHPDFRLFFNSLILGFTDQGYSISWKVINCLSYGLPQNRKRLVMIGAGPGERLPDFPPRTHSGAANDGLRPYATIRQAVSKINPSVAMNDIHHRPFPSRPTNDAIVSDPDGPLRRCMTTSGGQNRHWNNERAYSNREFACLQGFPTWHRFSNKCVKKQIGNAFPPVVVQAFYNHIQRHLHQHDGFQGLPKPMPVARGGLEPRWVVIEEPDEPGEDQADVEEVVGGMRPVRRGSMALLRPENMPWPRSVSQEPLAGVSRQIPIVIEEEEEGEEARADAGRAIDVRRHVPDMIGGVKQEQIRFY